MYSETKQEKLYFKQSYYLGRGLAKQQISAFFAGKEWVYPLLSENPTIKHK